MLRPHQRGRFAKNCSKPKLGDGFGCVICNQQKTRPQLWLHRCEYMPEHKDGEQTSWLGCLYTCGVTSPKVNAGPCRASNLSFLGRAASANDMQGTDHLQSQNQGCNSLNTARWEVTGHVRSHDWTSGSTISTAGDRAMMTDETPTSQPPTATYRSDAFSCSHISYRRLSARARGA
jgi:hypothetical protein